MSQQLKIFIAKTSNEKQENTKEESKKGAVKAKPDAAQGLRDFFEDGLKDIFWAEHALTKALPKMAKNATCSKQCDAMEELLKEADGIMEQTEAGVVRDAALIAAAQKVEHYEIATYGTLRAYAVTLSEKKATALLAKTLEEEKNADVSLTEIALSDINLDAAQAHA
jgi:ferritin-like metal-binding protein YciE